MKLACQHLHTNATTIGNASLLAPRKTCSDIASLHVSPSRALTESNGVGAGASKTQWCPTPLSSSVDGGLAEAGHKAIHMLAIHMSIQQSKQSHWSGCVPKNIHKLFSTRPNHSIIDLARHEGPNTHPRIRFCLSPYRSFCIQD